jgi:bifunctional ADP-heptose synthase (sugar kinase/adenylyltransferase)
VLPLTIGAGCLTNMQPKILVLGDAMLDNYFIGEATRISPEAPIPVVKVHDCKTIEGGAANVVNNLRALGAEVAFPREEAIHGCPVKNRLMVGNTQVARWDVADDLPPYDITLLDRQIRDWRPDGIVVSDYAKGSINYDVINWVAKQNIATFVDTKRGPWNTTWTYFPNRHEYEQYRDTYVDRVNVIYKRGPEGIDRLHSGKVVEHYPAYARHVVSVIGAGDIILANYVYATLAGRPDALFRASVAAAVAVEKPWTSIVTNDEIDARIKEIQ